MSDEKKYLDINMLEDFVYCEQKAFLLLVRGAEIPQTGEVLSGKIDHNKRDEILTEGGAPTTLGEVLEESRVHAKICPHFPVKCRRLGLKGKADEIFFAPDRIVMVENKPQARPFLSYKVQAWAYTLALQEEIGERDTRPLETALRHTVSPSEIFWREEFTPSSAAAVERVVLRIRSLLAGMGEWHPTTNPTKCERCNLSSICMKEGE